jgi:hypothetical protein
VKMASSSSKKTSYVEEPPTVYFESSTAKAQAHATMKDAEDAKELISDTVATGLDGNEASNAVAHSTVSATVIDTYLIEDFEVR